MINAFYRNSPAPGRKLRIGLLLDGLETSAVVARIIEDIAKSNFASIELVVLHDEAPAGPLKPKWRRKLEILLDSTKRRHLLYSQYCKFDEARAPRPSPDAPVDCSASLASVPQTRVRPIGKRFVHRFPDEALATIAGFDLDVLLRFGFNILRGGILKSARYGVWSYHHGNNDAYRGGPPLFWELVENNPESGVILQVLEEALDDGIVLRKSVFPTRAGHSWSANRFGPYWASQHFVIEMLWRLHNFGWQHLQAHSRKAGVYTGKQPIYRAPTNTQMAGWLGPGLIKKRLYSRKAETEFHWKIALRPLPSNDSAIRGPLNLTEFQWIESPKGHFWADPFLFEWQGKTYLFIEDYIYGRKKGILAVAPLDDPAKLVFEPCLEEPFHLSYPAVFASGDQIYMIPETCEAGEIRLYVAERFPHRWKLVKALLPLPAVDTTPWFDGERWWLFVTTCEAEHCPSLLLFSSPTLEGEWRYHPANPLSGDLKDVRNAGAIFRAGGRLYRPSQSARDAYGSSFTLHEIVRLTETDYEERPVSTTKAAGLPNIIGTHTYGRTAAWEVIDGCFVLPASDVR